MNPNLQVILHNITTRLAKLEEAQPKKEWVGLTDKEIERMALTDKFWFISKSGTEAFEWGEFAKAVEAKLKEKNG